MAKYHQYKEYKDSGEWLGEIPSHWDIQPTKRFFRLITEPAPDNNNHELLSVYTEIGVKPRKELEQKGNKATTTDGYWLVKKGDIVINKLLAWMGAVGYSEYDGVTSPAYDILRPTKKLNPKFYHYLFRTKIANMEFKRWSRGIMEMRLRLYFDELGRISMPFPTFEEQNKIVDFLDHETTKIDSLIEKQQQLIQLLKEKRQAVISHAVTKGLNPDVAMKDSGVEWLGEIPSHWGTVFLKMVIDVRDGTHETPAYVEPTINSYPLVTSKDVTGGWVDLSECKHISESDYRSIIKRSNVAKGDILMPMIGTVGSPVIVKDELEIAIKNLALFRTSDENLKIYNKFLYYFLNSEECNIQFILEGRGGVQNFVSLGTLRNLRLPYLSLNEQTEIADFLDYETTKIDHLINKVKQQIQLMQERRTALISAAVTGKIDVRNWQNPNNNNEAKTEFSA